MAIHRDLNGQTQLTRLVAEPPLLTLPPVTLDVPAAAEYFASLQDEDQMPELRAVLELGVEARKVIRTNATIKEFESRMAGLSGDLELGLKELLAKDREVSKEELQKLLMDHVLKLTTGLNRYLDPESAASVPVAMAKALEKVVENFHKRAEQLLSEDGDGSALGRLGDRIVEEVQKGVVTIVEQNAERRGLRTKSNLAGRPYEDEVETHLARLARPLRDTVTRVGDTPGLCKRKSGDFLVEFDPALTGGRPVRLVIELKKRGESAQSFTAPRIITELNEACENRGADAALFVTDSAGVLPAGIGFQELAPGKIAVAFAPDGDDTALAVAIGVLRSQLLAGLATEGALDPEAVRAAVAAVRQTMGNLEQVRSHHESATNSIRKASTVLDDIRNQVFVKLAKLESLVQ